MLDDVQKIDLTKHDLEMISSALQTQEKILSVQGRAGADTARMRLNDLKGLMRRLNRFAPDPKAAPSQKWSQIARSLFC